MTTHSHHDKISSRTGSTNTVPYASLFDATKRNQNSRDIINHHLINYTFLKKNNYKDIPASLNPRKPPLHSNNTQFNRRWKYITLNATHKHLKLLIKECKEKKDNLSNKEHWYQMELLRNSGKKIIFAWPYRLSVCWLKGEQQRVLISNVSLNPILLIHSIPFPLTALISSHII